MFFLTRNICASNVYLIYLHLHTHYLHILVDCVQDRLHFILYGTRYIGTSPTYIDCSQYLSKFIQERCVAKLEREMVS
jgi:hypothetical protein